MNAVKQMTLFVTLAALAACGKTPTASDVSQVVDSRAGDVTVLQAWLGTTAAVSLPGSLYSSGNFKLSMSGCTEVSRQTYEPNPQTGGFGARVTQRCTDELELKARLPGHDQVSPLLNDALFTHDEYQYPNTALNYYTVSGNCEIVEYRTVTRDAALNSPTFAGIGFFLRPGSEDGSQRFWVGKDRLHAVGHVTLKDGAPATVHRFISKGMCFATGGNGGSIYSRYYKFRPYARFDDGGNEYQVWDDVQTDYLLGKNPDGVNPIRTESFDRQLEILKQ